MVSSEYKKFLIFVALSVREEENGYRLIKASGLIRRGETRKNASTDESII
jgi:hypothetical protein